MKKGFIALILLWFLALLPAAAMADTNACVSTTNTGLNVEVCFTVAAGSGTQFTLTTNTITGLEGFTIKSIDDLGWNSTATFISGPEPGAWDDKFLPANQTDYTIDGFSPNDWKHEAVGTGNLSNGGFGTWTFDGDPGTDIVFHIQYNNGALTPNGCSLFVADRDNEGTSSVGAGCSPVPEPATLTLLGTGLIGLGGLVRRRLGRKA